MTITMTQFHPPNGRQEQVTCSHINDACQAGYAAMQQAGCRLTSEELSTGHISVCIEHPDGDVAIRVIPNGPRVLAAVEAMLLAFKPEHVAEMLMEELE